MHEVIFNFWICSTFKCIIFRKSPVDVKKFRSYHQKLKAIVAFAPKWIQLKDPHKSAINIEISNFLK